MTSKQALEDIKKFDALIEDNYYEYQIIEQDLKILEIIKDRMVDMTAVKWSKTLEDYKRKVPTSFARDKGLTEDEFNLIKQWLG